MLLHNFEGLPDQAHTYSPIIIPPCIKRVILHTPLIQNEECPM
jgi:hypothetical protein